MNRRPMPTPWSQPRKQWAAIPPAGRTRAASLHPRSIMPTTSNRAGRKFSRGRAQSDATYSTIPPRYKRFALRHRRSRRAPAPVTPNRRRFVGVLAAPSDSPTSLSMDELALAAILCMPSHDGAGAGHLVQTQSSLAPPHRAYGRWCRFGGHEVASFTHLLTSHQG